MVEYEAESKHNIGSIIKEILLHPDDVKSINDEYWSFIRKSVFDGKEVEFEIVAECCTPEDQIKRYIDCKGCDKKPSYAKLVDKLGNEDVPKLGYDVKEHEILKEMRTMSAKHGFEEHSFFTRETQNQKRLSFYFGARWGYDKAKSTLYTEEQVREVVSLIRTELVKNQYNHYSINYEEIIQSLKQPKQ